MKETQQSIASWAQQAFGDAVFVARVAARANEEMAELLRVASLEASITEEVLVGSKKMSQVFDPWRDRIADECADVVIVLMRLAAMLEFDLLDEIDKKMAVNRARQWRRDGSGYGYHVRDEAVS